ncbi:SIN1-domain-containing protein [Fomitiporia mediterranea MF3/22]|uniref:SIN1-domain-containing protein n=1 Tax=Fomitiporia mediterranea (strain MF3/22) TaxID=694068 RepID=UPI0004408957|nr:SIN1-domain-containing protein [Fomitiporia mediterranea MF3/22]EJD01500.1 SIN1-domain-containing protein [Fomitiporia mediterranea MF3/22]
MPSSPPVSDDEGTSNAPNGRRMHTGFPGATGLKYTQTIMGHRAGMAGMRVSGRRVMHGREASIRRSISASSSTPRRVRAGSEPTPAAIINTNDGEGASASPGTHDESLIQVSKRRSAGGTSLQEMPSTLIDKAELENKAEPGSVTNLPAALQGMPHIAAVQARRQRRRAHFSSGRDNGNRPIIISETKLNPEESSSDEEAGNSSGSLTDDDDYVVEVEGSLDAENDGFDPDFAPPRIALNSDSSEFLNSASNSALSTSISSAYNSLQIGGSARGKGKLSPVSETRPYEYSSGPSNAPDSSVDGTASEATTRRDAGSHIDDYFEIVKPPAPAVRLSGHLKRANEEMSSNKRLSSDKSAIPSSEELVFTRRKVPPARSVSSGLTAKLAASDTSSNPFTELYALISGRAEVASMEVTVFFPHATKPANKPLKLTVRKDATIEEVIGFSLWSYWEEGWLPKLDEGLSDERKKERLSAVGWILRIAEDDGEVDEDFPAPDRMGKISKFNFDAYAILEANQGQAAQNAQLEAKIVRRPSRIIVSKTPSAGLAPPAPPLLGPSVSTTPASALGTSVGMLGTSLNISSSHGSQVLLRIRMANADEKATHYMTTISVYSTMYMQEVLEHICRKRRIENPKEWALLSDDRKILVPLDRTVASLEGNSHLVLIQRVHLPEHGFAIDGDKRTTRSIDPNASIFKGVSETQPKGKGVDPAFDVYKRYTVFRKVPMLVARMERTLAIDGDYIHIMPSANKARGVFDSGKTVSYHIKSVVNCSQSGKGSATFKIIFRRDGGDKRYDFEAESARLATDIVSTVRGMRVKRGLERSSTVHKIRRRSRQVT